MPRPAHALDLLRSPYQVRKPPQPLHHKHPPLHPPLGLLTPRALTKVLKLPQTRLLRAFQLLRSPQTLRTKRHVIRIQMPQTRPHQPPTTPVLVLLALLDQPLAPLLRIRSKSTNSSEAMSNQDTTMPVSSIRLSSALSPVVMAPHLRRPPGPDSNRSKW